MIDEILERLNLKYEDLTVSEKDTLNSWMGALQNSDISVHKIKEYIEKMRDSVEEELTKTGHDSKQDIFLKARLRNYMLLLSFLTGPERAKQALEQAISGIVPRK